MAALLKFTTTHGRSTATETIRRLNCGIEATLRRQAHERPTLVCRWQQGADGHLSCYWDIEVPDIPIPPH
jgi:hypothetical protein